MALLYTMVVSLWCLEWCGVPLGSGLWQDLVSRGVQQGMTHGITSISAKSLALASPSLPAVTPSVRGNLAA